MRVNNVVLRKKRKLKSVPFSIQCTINDIGYCGPLSLEWEDGGMDREFGAKESCAFVRKLDFPISHIAFDAAFEKAGIEF